MSSFRTRKLRGSRRHRQPVEFGCRALEEGVHGLRRHLVPDGRVRPFPVVVDLDELDHRALRGVSGGEAPAVVHLIFQRREERLCDGVAAAVAGAAAGEARMVAPGRCAGG